MTKFHKYLIVFVALASALGVIWKWASSADARYAKQQEAVAMHTQLHEETEKVSQDLVELGKTFQFNNYELAIERKRDAIRQLDRDIYNPRTSEKEKSRLKSLRQQYQDEIDSLIRKQQRLDGVN